MYSNDSVDSYVEDKGDLYLTLSGDKSQSKLVRVNSGKLRPSDVTSMGKDHLFHMYTP